MYYPTSGAEYDATEKVYCGLEKLCKLAKGEDNSMGDGMVSLPRISRTHET